MKWWWSLAGVVLACAGFGAEPEIEFAGVLSNGRETQVALVNRTSGQTRWVGIGREFGGYTVVSYQAKNDTVILSRDGQQYALPLKSGSKVKPGAVEPPPEVKRAILNNLRQLAAAADQFYLENGKNRVTLDELVGDTKYVKRLVVVDGENYRAIEFAQGKAMQVTTASGGVVSYAP